MALCCFGAGGHGKVVASQWRARHGGDVVYADEYRAIGTMVDGVEVAYAALDAIAGVQIIVTIGDNATRARIQQAAERRGLALASLVSSPDLYFASPPGAGSVVLAGAVVNCEARIGSGAIINSSAVIEHGVTVGDFSHVSPNATITGEVRLGERVWVGAGATILPGLAIVSDTVIGAGAVVSADIDTSGTYVGIPAKRMQRPVLNGQCAIPSL